MGHTGMRLGELRIKSNASVWKKIPAPESGRTKIFCLDGLTSSERRANPPKPSGVI